MNLLLFIDPGEGGGTVIYDSASGCIAGSAKWENPTIFSEWIDSRLKSHGVQRCYIELLTGLQKGRHKMSPDKSFKMGKNYGIQLGIILSQRIPFEEIRPQDWQKGLGLRGLEYAAKKKRLADLAKQRFPDNRVINATADAYMMADWHFRRYGLTSEDVGL